jgi:hypothetical protein
MKKLIMGICAMAVCASFAQDKSGSAPATQPAQAEAAAPAVPTEKAQWPVPIALNSTKDIDVVGMRFTLPYGECENVTGFDIGLFGRCRYFEGLQLNLVRNDVKDVLAGIQIGLYNSAARADLMGIQIGLWNEAQSIRGFQIGLVNVANSACGFQVGLINRAESAYGFQAGGINIIRESDMPFLPIVNIGIDSLLNY